MEDIQTDDMPAEDNNENPYKPLLGEARSYVRGIMSNGKDSKLGLTAALEILDRGGEVRKRELTLAPQIHIEKADILLLAKTAQEVKGELE